MLGCELAPVVAPILIHQEEYRGSVRPSRERSLCLQNRGYCQYQTTLWLYHLHTSQHKTDGSWGVLPLPMFPVIIAVGWSLRRRIISDRDLASVLGKSRVVAEIIESRVHHRTRHQDRRRQSSESHFCAGMHLQRRSWLPVRPTEGVSEVDFLGFTMDGIAPRWMGLRLIIDSSTTDGPQQDTLAPRRTSLSLANFCQARTSQGTEEIRKTRHPRNSSDKGGLRWG